MIYLDISAFVKLVRAEPESGALGTFLGQQAGARLGARLVSSALLIVEARRAAEREDPSTLARTDLLLTRIGRIGMTSGLVESASRLPGRFLRSLDAIHLATALLLRDDLGAMVTYDERLATAAADHALPVVAPG